MRIALDYDNTYSADPSFWDSVVELARKAGHDVRCVTARNDRFDRTAPLVALEAKMPVIYTHGVAKRWFLEHFGEGFLPDVYIDDKPESILANSPTSPADLAAWRAGLGDGPSIPVPCACGGSCACA